jgi:hypothetical protein
VSDNETGTNFGSINGAETGAERRSSVRTLGKSDAHHSSACRSTLIGSRVIGIASTVLVSIVPAVFELLISRTSVVVVTRFERVGRAIATIVRTTTNHRVRGVLPAIRHVVGAFIRSVRLTTRDRTTSLATIRVLRLKTRLALVQVGRRWNSRASRLSGLSISQSDRIRTGSRPTRISRRIRFVLGQSQCRTKGEHTEERQ